MGAEEEDIFDKNYVLVEFAHFLGIIIRTTIDSVCYIPIKIADFIILRITILLD